MYGREKGWRSVNVKVKKNIKNNYKKMERKKIMTWTLTWLNVSAAILNARFQFLVKIIFFAEIVIPSTQNILSNKQLLAKSKN